jgi:N6-adenosine-specific RNA methylase IME4
MKYKTIVIDAPWPESGGGRIKRGADRHYPLLSVKEIPSIIVTSGVFTPAADSHLYLWATNNYLDKGIALIGALGFRYVTCITWVKPGRPGLGQYFRGATEQLLFGVRGAGLQLRRAWTTRRDLSTRLVADWPRDEAGKIIHSAKPKESYELIEAASPAPRLEMFARPHLTRRRRTGWTVWGRDVA